MRAHQHSPACIESIELHTPRGKRHLVLCKREALTPRKPYRPRAKKHLTLGDIVFWFVVAPPPGPF
jgi:hypothetical protein